MTATFLFQLSVCLTLPALVGKVLRVERLLPKAILQLTIGLLLSPIVKTCCANGLDSGPGMAVQGVGWLGAVVLISLAAANSPLGEGRQAWRFLPLSLVGFGATLVAGTGVGLFLIHRSPELAGPNARDLTYALAIGLCLAVTALPILIAILDESALKKTTIASAALFTAFLDEIWLWLGVGVILSLTAASTDEMLKNGVIFIAYLAFMVGVAQPLLRRLVHINLDLTIGPAFCLSAILLSAGFTDLIGFHPIVGAFLCGAILPKRAIAAWSGQLLNIAQHVLTPVYFVISGLKADLHLLDPQFWQLIALFTVASVGVKTASVALAARLIGMNWRDSFWLGSLMQCKGVMELVAINVFIDAGIIDGRTYSALAFMAIISTLLATTFARMAPTPGTGRSGASDPVDSA